MKKFLIHWLPVLIWAGIIFYLSSVPDLKTELKQDFILRKIAHITEFAILAFLLFRAISAYGYETKRAVIYVFIIALFYAFSDEFHQFFIEGRQCSFRDVAIDSVGILISSIICYIKNSKSSKVDIKN